MEDDPPADSAQSDARTGNSRYRPGERPGESLDDERWPGFEEILSRLHQEGIYIHSDQLAEFLLRHGLPVHLRYVPSSLRDRALFINKHYQGDMAKLVEELPRIDYLG
jgi:hypothetical protein